jgi:virulence factor Mce-like protein
MRRIALIALVLCLGGAALATAGAGADDTHEYKVELDNAFGIVEGSLIKIAGVEAGRVTALDINEDKRAVISFETSGEIGVLGEDTTCSSEPQSLIAEYFIDCQPAGDPMPEGSTIPVEQVTQTVQPDLVNNTLREPFKRRLQLIINEFGTALAGNPENLNAAIRRGAPALRELEQVLDILGDQNRIIRDLNENSDRVISRLAERRDDVVRFIKEAGDTAEASAARRADLSRNFELLPDFLAELEPTLADTEQLARAQTPVLADLRASAPGLNTLARNLPAFNESSRLSLNALGDAAVVGERAMTNGADEIRILRRAFKNAPRSAELLDHLLADLHDPRRAVEIDARAQRDTGRSSSKPGTKNTMGYTALEGLLNYAYYQAGALNQYDEYGHLLHFSLYGVNQSGGPCGEYETGRDHETGEPGVPAEDGGTTTNILEAHRCVAWLGDSAPGINEDLGLPRYDPSVCPGGTEPERAAEELCDPNVESNRESVARFSSETDTDGDGAPDTAGLPNESGTSAPPVTGAPIPGLPAAPGEAEEVQSGLEDLLGLPGGANAGDAGKGQGALDDLLGGRGKGGKGGGGNGGAGGASTQTTNELMEFLFG